MNRKTIGWIGAGLIAAGVTAYLLEQYKLSKKITYDFKNLRMIGGNLDSMRISIDMLLKNAGMLQVDISKVRFDVYANGVYISRITQLQGAQVKPHSTAIIPLQIAFSPREVFGQIGQIISLSRNVDNIYFEFDGWVTVRKAGIPIPIPIREGMSVREMKA